jgi:WD40 repeat protein
MASELHVDQDCTVWIWDVQTTKMGAGPFHHESELVSLAFSPDGRNIVSGLGNGIAQIWDAEIAANSIEQFLGHTDRVNGVSFCCDGQHILSGSDNKIRQQDSPSLGFHTWS